MAVECKIARKATQEAAKAAAALVKDELCGTERGNGIARAVAEGFSFALRRESKTETSAVLGLLTYLIRNYIMAALERNEGEHGTNNIVQGLLQHVVWYIFEARKGISLDDLVLTWASGDLRRSEGYVRNSLSNTDQAAQQELSTLLLTDDVDDDWNENTG
ncbi:hypothetical protein SUGI_0976060 [Cryptomeria japonica]|nr:hypothetical protein SUGI_0976060 [Cryptomeria japonica]